MKKFIFFILLVGHGAAHAAGLPTLDEVVVTATATDTLGVAATSSEGTITRKQLENRPLLRPAEVMEVVPGLIVSQHSGDGKANQYYLRGFNLDHGTDFSSALLGMPVNMPTHAHGQGYTDLNFLIPELVDRVQYRKGTYYAGDGDFSAAGSARIDYVREVAAPYVLTTLGSGAYERMLAVASPKTEQGRLLLAAEGSHNDGPWIVPEHLLKKNMVMRYAQGNRNDGWDVALLGYDASWTATDQIAQRAMSSVGRYGSLDSTTGGTTHRYSLSSSWAGEGTHANVYAIDYALELWSNFTYATDTVHGDQFLQRDKRNILGGSLTHDWIAEVQGTPVVNTLGSDVRYDDIDVGVFLTQQRAIWGSVRNDKVQQGSVALWGESQVQWLPHFRSIVGLRGDAYHFAVNSDTAANSGARSAALLSPKLSLVFGPWAQTEYYLNAGRGFHSNDARGAAIRVNPDPRPGTRAAGCTGTLGSCTGDPLSQVSQLVSALGYELGMRSVSSSGLQTALTLWQLDIDSELIFVGDAGTTAASRPSRRRGVEWANYWQANAWLLLDGDISLSQARFTDADPAGSFVPGAVEQVASLGLSAQDDGPWSAGVRLRYFGPRPLVADNSIRSNASALLNLHAGYRVSKAWQWGLEILNLLDAPVSDIDYYYASQLRGEAAPVNDIHTHPAEPRTLRVSFKVDL